ncbi:MAG: hypothetical protein ETSY1_45430 [Candidatus Entotheonella factor]|uniref:Uncharacterized protein n=1 Tax=Entotheonella factor TaxID=1429438 RepID=W4L3Y9_ENTF1|nr:MAG: hypothetical protein ETSY1_45430 [Candidatus Entotheonella factor]
MPVKRCARDTAEFLAELTDLCISVFHRGLGQTDLRFGQNKSPSPFAATYAGRCQSSHSALTDQLPLKLRQRRKNPKD